MLDKIKIETIDDQETILLVDVFKKLNLHTFVALKMFAAHHPIDESTLNLSKIRFIGKNIKIYRMGNNSNVSSWRVSKEIAQLIEKKFYKSGRSTRQLAEEKSKNLYSIELATKNNIDMQTSRFLLSMYENQIIKICANISKFSYITLYQNTGNHKKLRVSFENLINPQTQAVYSDHANVLINNDVKNYVLQFKIGTQLEFKAAVHSYLHHNKIKYGIHNIQDIRVFSPLNQ